MSKKPKHLKHTKNSASVWLGIRVDTDKNANAHKQNKDVVEITAWGAKVRTLVIETNEELMIARDTKEVLGNEGLL